MLTYLVHSFNANRNSEPEKRIQEKQLISTLLDNIRSKIRLVNRNDI